MNFQDYYTNQIGRGQKFYRGRRYQRGHGLGNVLGNLFRTAMPFLKKTATSVGKDLLKSGARAGSHALTDIVSGAPIKQSIKRRFVKEGHDLLNKKLKPNKTHKLTKKHRIRRKVISRKRPTDIFE